MRFNKERQLYRVMMACLMLSCAGYSHAEEIKIFKLLDVDGKISMRYLGDEQTDIDKKNKDLKKIDGTDIYELGVNIQTHSYIYHPNFLKVDLGGGPIQIRNTKTQLNENDILGIQRCGDIDILASSTCVNSVTETALNFNLRLNFLEQKSYPIAVYIERKNPLIVPNISEHFLQEITKYGSNFVFRGKAIPFTVNTEAYKLISQGGGEVGDTLVVDDDLSQVNLRVHQNNLRDGHRELLLQKSTQLSKSGNLLRDNSGNIISEIVGSDIDASSLDYDSRSVMGDSNQIVLRNSLNYVEQKVNKDASLVVDSITQTQYRPELRWNHSKTVHTFYRYDYLLSKQGFVGVDQVDLRTEKQRADIGYSNIESKFGSYTLSVDAESDVQTGLELSSYGTNAIFDYSTEFGEMKSTADINAIEPKALSKRKIKNPPFAKLKIHAGLGYHVFDRESADANKDIIVDRESHSFSGELSVELNHEFIKAPTIIVTSKDLTQVYIPLYDASQYINDELIPNPIANANPDYEVIVLGNRTQIRRFINGRIGETEQISVSYRYKAAGTFSHTSTETQLQMSLNMINRINVSAGISTNNITITSGERGFDLRSVENRNFGVNADWPVPGNITVGGDARLDKETKSILPNDRTSVSVYGQFAIFESAVFRLGFQKVRVEFDDPVIGNVDLARTTVNWSARPFSRSSMSLAVISEKDVGSLNPREILDVRYKWQWGFRQVYFNLEARHGVEKQSKVGGVAGSDFETRRSIIRATLERRF